MMMLKFQCKLILVGLVLKLCCAKFPSLDEKCFLISNGQQGVCKLINDCPAAKNTFKKTGTLPQACTPSNAEVVVCCVGSTTPLETSIEPLDIKSKFLAKCTEYSKSVPCMMKKLGEAPVNGNRLTSIKDYPHTAKIIYKPDPDDGIEYFDLDEGSLISSRYILTAATLLQAEGWIPYKVRFGHLVLVIDKANESPYEYDIEKFIVHPDYDSAHLHNDIALIKLSKKVIFSENVRPICLPDTDVESNVVYRINYEHQETKNLQRPLVKYQRKLVPNDICNLTHHDFYNGINDDFICTTATELGDSNYDYNFDGAPIVIDHPDVACSHILVGVSLQETKSRIADAALKVYNYRDWIEKIIWADGEDN